MPRRPSFPPSGVSRPRCMGHYVMGFSPSFYQISPQTGLQFSSKKEGNALMAWIFEIQICKTNRSLLPGKAPCGGGWEQVHRRSSPEEPTGGQPKCGIWGHSLSPKTSSFSPISSSPSQTHCLSTLQTLSQSWKRL